MIQYVLMSSKHYYSLEKSEAKYVDMYTRVNNNYNCEDRKVQHKRLKT